MRRAADTLGPGGRGQAASPDEAASSRRTDGVTRGGSMPHDQRETPYLDAVLAYRRRGYTPFHTPGHKLGKGAPAEAPRASRRRPAFRSTSRWPGRSRTRASRPASSTSPRSTRPRRGARTAATSSSTARRAASTLWSSRWPAPARPLIVPRNAHKSLLAALIYSGATPFYVEPPDRARHGASRSTSTVAQADASPARPSRGQGAVRHVPDLQRPVRGPARHRRRALTRPGSRSSSTRPGDRICASAPSCRSTP